MADRLWRRHGPSELKAALDENSDFGTPELTILRLGGIYVLNQVCRFLFSRFDSIHAEDGWYKLCGAVPSNGFCTLVQKTPTHGTPPYRVTEVPTRTVVIVFKPHHPKARDITVKSLYFIKDSDVVITGSFVALGFSWPTDVVAEDQSVLPDRLGGASGFVTHPANAFDWRPEFHAMVPNDKWPQSRRAWGSPMSAYEFQLPSQ